MSTGIMQFSQEYNDPALQEVANQYQIDQYGRALFSNGTFMPFGLTYVQETTVFREYGPLAGNTVRVGYEYAPSWGSLLSRQTADVDARYYLRLATNGVLAFRARGFKSWGEFPDYIYFGGNSEMRGYDYLEFLGNKGTFLNAELRFPLANFGGAGYEGVPLKLWTNEPLTVTPLLGFEPNFTTLTYDPIYGDPATINGFKLVDGRASYGVGLETFALGFPIHFDWSWRTTFNKDWEDALFATNGGSAEFRKPRFAVWIGYDF